MQPPGKAAYRWERREPMNESLNTPRTLNLLALMLCTTSVTAEDAFRPPETPSGRERLVGIQVEHAGFLGPMDSLEMRNTRRKTCEALGKPYVNTAPLGVDGQSRSVAVQANGTSYYWLETQRVTAEDPKEICRLGVKTIRQLSIARFDGRRTHTTTYDYAQRAALESSAEGDLTALGAAEQPKSFSNLPLVSRRVLAGLECDERRILDVPGITQHSVCMSAPNPVPGRSLPLMLARDWNHPRIKMHATAVRPKVLVDPAVFQGPPGFSAPPVASMPDIKDETSTDVDAEDDAEQGKAPR